MPTLTVKDKKDISDIISSAPERYPLKALYVFKGKNAFDLHSKMVSLKENWLEMFSIADKSKSNLIVFVQTTVSRNTVEKQKTRRQKILIIFDIPGNNSPVISSVSHNSTKGKKWLKLLHENKKMDLLGLKK